MSAKAGDRSDKWPEWAKKAPDWRAPLRRPLPFPLGAPTWPTAVPRPRTRSGLGVNYDTEWARRYPVRLARAAWTEVVTRPVMAAVAQPSVEGLDRLDHIAAPVIFASNHSSHLDTPLVLSVLPDKWRHKIVTLAAADYFFDTRLKAVYFAFSLNAVPIVRTASAGTRPTGPRSYWPRAGTCSSSPRAAAAPTVGARSTMGARHGWPLAAAAPSYPSISRARAACGPGAPSAYTRVRPR